MAESVPVVLTPRDSAIAILKAEHRVLGNVVHTLQEVLEGIAADSCVADFQLVASMLYYLDAFPERCHHPKEDRYLFRCLRARTEKANGILDALAAQHVTSERLMISLEQSFVRYQGGAPGGLRSFAKAVNAYAELQWKHMDLEETRMLSLASEYLSDKDWVAIDRAFRANEDPLSSPDAQDEFAQLRQRIVNRLPTKLRRRARA